MAKRKRTRTSSGSSSRSHRDRHGGAVNFDYLDPLKPSELLKDTFKREVRRVRDDIKKLSKPHLEIVEDLRRVPKDFNRIKTFLTRSGRVAKTEVRPSRNLQKSWLHAPLHTYFRDPLRAIVCIRREARKRVLFALRRVGKGRSVSRTRHFTDKSFIRCK